ncbi:hypothetical protein AURDEDRAFT_120912 [Auricularia subglabra TFB-10046 SS5]|nr:hypothetical protein AURDEDRAFT_120912 [Auricularia subglabra TFB-10046 SS5]
MRSPDTVIEMGDDAASTQGAPTGEEGDVGAVDHAAAHAPALATDVDYIVDGTSDCFYLFNETIFKIAWSLHPGSRFLVQFLHDLDIKPTIASSVAPLTDHPLWDSDDNGIVLYEGVRPDGVRRTFFHIRQIDVLRDAACSAATAAGAGFVSGVPLSLSKDVKPFWVAGEAAHKAADEDHVLAGRPEKRVYATAPGLSGLRALNRSRGGATAASTVRARPAPQRSQPAACDSPEEPDAYEDPFAYAQDDFRLAYDCYHRREGTWVGLDLEASQQEKSRITEIGLTTLTRPDDVAQSFHLIISDNLAFRDHMGGPRMRSALVAHASAFLDFLYGTSEVVSLAAGLQRLVDAIAEARAGGPVYVVFHDMRMEKKLLMNKTSPILPLPRRRAESAHEDPHAPGFLAYFDTQVVYGGKTGKRASDSDRISLGDLLQACKVDAPLDYWHNAGNDAVWALQTMRALLGRAA